MNKFLEEAIRIGDELLDMAERDNHGITWKTVSVDMDRNVSLIKTDHLYGGASGIVLFLLALHRQTKDKKYLTASVEAMQWISWYMAENPTSNYAFYTGNLSASYVFAELYSITKKHEYLKNALNIAYKSDMFLKDYHDTFDILNGISGSLLALLKIHSLSGDPKLLSLIKDFIDELLKHARLGKTGIYWDTMFSQIRPLSGFSHGPSGIGFVFLELGRYSQNPAFYYVAEQAFAYENSLFDKSINNWPDFRLNLYGDEIKEYESAYNKNNLKIFNKSLDVVQWCHGAPGIGLTRVRAYEILKKQSYLNDLKNALIKTPESRLPSFTLCHGLGGNADIFLESYLQSGDKQYLDYANSIGDQAINQYKNKGRYLSGFKFDEEYNPHDTSLFSGLAGIGYFFLRLVDPTQTPSILAPRIEATAKAGFLNTSVPEIKKQLITNEFPRTVAKTEELAQKDINDFWQEQELSPAEFTAFVNKISKKLPPSQQKEFSELLHFETEKLRHQQNNNNGLTFIKEKLASKKANKLLQLNDYVFSYQSLRLSEEVKLYEFNKHHILLRVTSLGVRELPVSTFCFQVLTAFQKAKTVKKVIEEITKLYKAQTNEDKALVKKNVIEQIKEGIQSGVIQKANRISL